MPKIGDQILVEVQLYKGKRTSAPEYVVIDGESYLEFVREIAPEGGNLTEYMGLRVVVVPTNGVRFMRVVGSPLVEAVMGAVAA